MTEKDTGISIEDVEQVASDLGMETTLEQRQAVVENYAGAEEEDPTATWDLIVEQLLYEELG